MFRDTAQLNTEYWNLPRLFLSSFTQFSRSVFVRNGKFVYALIAFIVICYVLHFHGCFIIIFLAVYYLYNFFF